MVITPAPRRKLLDHWLVWAILAILAAYGPAHRKVVADEDQLTAEADARAPRDSAAVQELFNRYVVGVRIVEMTDM